MLRTILFFTTLLIIPVVGASNFNFLHQATPISDFKKEDKKIFMETIQQALNEKKDGERLAWQNEKTGNSGLVNPLLTLDKKDGECRNVRIINKSKKNIAESWFKFCKTDGKWVAVEMLQK